MKHLFFLFFGIITNAQSMISGTIRSENNSPLANVFVINTNTSKTTQSDNEGKFKIEASTNEEIRFVKEKYDRASLTISNENTNKPISIELLRTATTIKQVNLTTSLSGILSKDIRSPKTMEKTFALNQSISKMMKNSTNKPTPNKHISIAAPKDPNEGQLMILSVSTSGEYSGILSVLAKHIIPSNIHTNEKEMFHQKIKQSFYDNYYKEYGINESAFDHYIKYMEQKEKLYDKYKTNFDIIKIDSTLKTSIKDFIE